MSNEQQDITMRAGNVLERWLQVAAPGYGFALVIVTPGNASFTTNLENHQEAAGLMKEMGEAMLARPEEVISVEVNDAI